MPAILWRVTSGTEWVVIRRTLCVFYLVTKCLFLVWIWMRSLNDLLFSVLKNTPSNKISDSSIMNFQVLKNHFTIPGYTNAVFPDGLCQQFSSPLCTTQRCLSLWISNQWPTPVSTKTHPARINEWRSCHRRWASSQDSLLRRSITLQTLFSISSPPSSRCSR